MTSASAKPASTSPISPCSSSRMLWYLVVGERVVVAVQLGCPVGHRLLRVEDRGQHLVVDLDLAAALLGGAHRVGQHGDHSLADETHDVVEHVGVVGVDQVVGVDRGAVPLPRHVFPRVHPMHAGHRQRGRLVDRHDAGMRVRRVQHLEVQHPLHLGVHGVLGAAGDDVGARGRSDARADRLAGCRLLDLDDPVDGILDRAITGAATHRSRGQRHADVAADGGAVPHLERRQEGLAARGEQRVPAQWHQVDQAAKIRLLIGEQPGPARQPGVAFAPVAAGSIGRVSDNFGDGVDVHVKWPFDGWDRGTPGLETLRS